MDAPPPTAADFQVTMVPLDQLVPSGHNVRHCFGDPDDEIAIAQLAESLQKEGLLQPPNVVRRAPGAAKKGGGAAPDVYEVVAGMRRVRAAKKLGWSEIPCRVHEALRDAKTVSLMENLHRKAMRKQDMCRIVADMLAEADGNNVATVASQLHLGHTTVRRYALLGSTLDDDVLDRLDAQGDERLTLDEAERMARGILQGDDGAAEDSNAGNGGTVPPPDGDPPAAGEADEPPAKKKRKPNVKKEPWVYNRNDEAVPIPAELWAEVADRIVSSGLGAALQSK